MIRRQELALPQATGPLGGLLASLIILLLIAACTPPNKSQEELIREVQDLKKEVKALQEKVDKLQASQQTLVELLKSPALHPQAAASLPPLPVQLPVEGQPAAPAAPQTLTVSQLLAGKDQYLGARVTVKGAVGPVLVHHKSLLLKAPEGMVEVLFGQLPDQKQVQRLTSVPIEQPVTVTGVVNLPPKPGGAKLQINAEAINF